MQINHIKIEGVGRPEEDKEFLELCKLSELLDVQINKILYNKIDTLFPDSGPFRRELYKKHVDFMNGGAQYRQRACIAANRTGKTLMACTELTYHCTGKYPKWWKGRKFLRPVDCWAASNSTQSTKEILQNELLGNLDAGELGTGTIPRDSISGLTKKPGVAGAVETVYIKHVSGGVSKITFKAYEQGRTKFQGTKKQVILLDEEPLEDPEIYPECLTRTTGADGDKPGIILCTFTPLSGYGGVVQRFLPNMAYPQDSGYGYVDPNNPYMFIVRIDWEDVPHLTEEDKAELRASYSAHELDARTKGIFTLGHGALYPTAENRIVVEPFAIPDHWSKAYGLDVGWKRTAAIWVTQDPDTGQYYLYSEHYEGGALPPIHATAIRARGSWIWGVIDTNAKEISPTDGRSLLDQYTELGLTLIPAQKNIKEAAIILVNQMFESGQLKVFRTMTNFLAEKRQYRRNVDGKIADSPDHLIDALHYLIMKCPGILTVSPLVENEFKHSRVNIERDDITGY